MNYSLIPALIFLTIVIFSDSEDDPAKRRHYKKSERYKLTFKKDKDLDFKRVDQLTAEEQRNFDTIYNYIVKKHKNITPEDATEITQSLIDYGKKYKLDPKLAAALIARESSFNKEAISVTGAKGLGQIKDFNYKDLSIVNPFSIKENVSGTVKYLKKMIKNWEDLPESQSEGKPDKPSEKELDVKLGLASYFKGFTAVKKEGVDPKTEAYVEDIIENYKEIIKSAKKSKKKTD
ncbi:hypothetical protein DID76_01190 [Candidatus Marinamargulisbacteria bacterium SCGC AG-414-C22]|nr:hypothetical protein DID76_01190 [Candidatus Marinamargulisbacteria bacterium SCGC AG-414-C22]